MIKLSPRLLCAASFVRCRTKIADIGTDHAYLPAYLVEQGIADSVLACDIGVMPLKNAFKTVTEHSLSDKISLRLSDGLSDVSPDEADEIIICGMGGTLMASILEAAPWVKKKGMHLILQPMTHIEDVRKYLVCNGFGITEEKYVLDSKKLYCCISADFDGKERTVHEGFCRFGNFSTSDELNISYADRQLRRIENRLGAIEGKEEFRDEYEELLSIKNYYEQRLSDENT